MGAKIPAAVYNSAKAKGQTRVPDTGYYAATIAKVTKGTNRPTTWILTHVFENGFDTMGFVDVPFDENGEILPGFVETDGDGNPVFLSEEAERQYNAMLNEVKAVFVSAGKGREAEEDLDLDQLVGQKVYVEWHNAHDTGRKYGRIVGHLEKSKYDKLIAAGSKPAVAGAAEAATTAAGGAEKAPAVTAKSAVQAPSNGTTTGTTPRIPRPSVAARSVIPRAQ